MKPPNKTSRLQIAEKAILLLILVVALTGCKWLRDQRAAVVISPAKARVEQGGFIQFIATRAGKPVENASWSLDKQDVGTVSKKGLFQAAYQPGSFKVLLKNAKGKVLGEETVQITPATNMLATTGFVELYDPMTGQFQAVGSMAQPRYGHSATLMTDGRVLILGGSDYQQDFTASEVFDPATLSFSPSPANLFFRREGQAAVLLKDGRLLVVGGIPYGDSSNVGDCTELLDQKTNTFKPFKSVELGRYPCNTLNLKDGRVLFAGKGLEIYDPATDKFTFQEEARDKEFAGMASAVLEDGRVLFCGGTVEYGGGVTVPVNKAFLFYPSSGTLSVAGGLSRGRTGHVLVPIRGGGAQVVGGTVREELAPMHMMDPSGQTFNLAHGSNHPADSMEGFDPIRSNFTSVQVEALRNAGPGLLLKDGQTFLWVGGFGWDPTDFIGSQNIQSGVATQVPPLAIPRSGHTMTLLKDGRVLIVGGRTKNR